MNYSRSSEADDTSSEEVEFLPSKKCKPTKIFCDNFKLSSTESFTTSCPEINIGSVNTNDTISRDDPHFIDSSVEKYMGFNALKLMNSPSNWNNGSTALPVPLPYIGLENPENHPNPHENLFFKEDRSLKKQQEIGSSSLIRVFSQENVNNEDSFKHEDHCYGSQYLNSSFMNFQSCQDSSSVKSFADKAFNPALTLYHNALTEIDHSHEITETRECIKASNVNPSILEQVTENVTPTSPLLLTNMQSSESKFHPNWPSYSSAAPSSRPISSSSWTNKCIGSEDKPPHIPQVLLKDWLTSNSLSFLSSSHTSRGSHASLLSTYNYDSKTGTTPLLLKNWRNLSEAQPSVAPTEVTPSSLLPTNTENSGIKAPSISQLLLENRDNPSEAKPTSQVERRFANQYFADTNICGSPSQIKSESLHKKLKILPKYLRDVRQSWNKLQVCNQECDSSAKIAATVYSVLSTSGTDNSGKEVPVIPEKSYNKRLTDTAFKVGFVDSHCHIDFLFGKLKFNNSLQAFMVMCEEDNEPFPKSYEGCIAVFCDPSTFHKTDWWQSHLSNEKVWGAFGCHPHFADKFGAYEEYLLKNILQHHKVKAIGEMGLDFSGRNSNDSEIQEEVFRRQLQIALQIQKPIVIHSRDSDEEVLTILKEVIPRDHIIHKHCFTGSLEEAERWLSNFPNCYIGLTGLITQSSDRGRKLRDVAKMLPLNRLLLETDAPYFRPGSLPSRELNVSHPGMAIYVASEIALLKNITIEEVLQHVRTNTTAVYSV